MANFKLFTSLKEQKQRLDICNQCENYNLNTNICNICSCYMPIKCRVIWLKCPIGKWDRAKDTEYFDIEQPHPKP